jgi:hypothetical protein
LNACGPPAFPARDVAADRAHSQRELGIGEQLYRLRCVEVGEDHAGLDHAIPFRHPIPIAASLCRVSPRSRPRLGPRRRISRQRLRAVMIGTPRLGRDGERLL